MSDLELMVAVAAQNVVPVAVTAGDKIEGLRQWVSGRCLSADRIGRGCGLGRPGRSLPTARLRWQAAPRPLRGAPTAPQAASGRPAWPAGRCVLGDAARGCPCHLAGRSLRASCPPVARCCPRFGILPALGQQRRSIGTGNPSQAHRWPWDPRIRLNGRRTPLRARTRPPGSAAAGRRPAKAWTKVGRMPAAPDLRREGQDARARRVISAATSCSGTGAARRPRAPAAPCGSARRPQSCPRRRGRSHRPRRR